MRTYPYGMTMDTYPGDCTISFNGCCVSPLISPGRPLRTMQRSDRPRSSQSSAWVRPFLAFSFASHFVIASLVKGGILPSGGSTIFEVRSETFGLVGSALQKALYSAPAIRYPGRPSSGLSELAY